MKITQIGKQFRLVGTATNALGLGGVTIASNSTLPIIPGYVWTAQSSNTAAWLPNVNSITANSSNTLQSPIVNFTGASGIAVTSSSNTVTIHGSAIQYSHPRPAAQTIYVATTGNDTTGDGSSGSPYLTINRALQDIPSIVIGHYTVDVADGTYREQVDLDRFVFPTFNSDGPSADGRIILDGNTTTPANCIISGADSGAPTTPVRDFCILTSRAYVTIQGFKLQYAVIRGIQIVHHSAVRLGKMEYDNTAAGFLLGVQSHAVLIGNQTISNCATGIYLTEFSRLNTDSGSRTITMTAITDRGLYVVESALLLNSGDVLSITAHSSGTRTTGIEADGSAIIDIPVTVTVSGAFVYSVAAVAGARVHLKSSTLTISGASTAAYHTAEQSTIWDTTNSAYLAPVWTTYTPTWTGSVTNPVIGNGTLIGRYRKLDDKVYSIHIEMTAGSTTTFGSGTWSFALPTAAVSSQGRQSLAGAFLDDGVAWGLATGVITAGSSTVTFVVVEAGNVATSTVPHTWATNDILTLSGTYETA